MGTDRLDTLDDAAPEGKPAIAPVYTTQLERIIALLRDPQFDGAKLSMTHDFKRQPEQPGVPTAYEHRLHIEVQGIRRGEFEMITNDIAPSTPGDRVVAIVCEMLTAWRGGK